MPLRKVLRVITDVGIATPLVKLLSYRAVEMVLLGRAERAPSAAFDRHEGLVQGGAPQLAPPSRRRSVGPQLACASGPL